MAPRFVGHLAHTMNPDHQLALDLTFHSLSDFAPDALVRNVPELAAQLAERQAFEWLLMLATNEHRDSLIVRALRDSRLLSDKDFDRALERAFDLATPLELRGVLSKLVDRMRGQPELAELEGSTAIRRLCEQINDGLNVQINAILRHPDFQSLDRAWHGLAYLVEHANQSSPMKVRILDCSKAQLHAALSPAVPPDEGSSLLTNTLWQPFGILGGEPYGCLLVDHEFDNGEQDVQLLDALATSGAACHVPVIASVASRLFGATRWTDLSVAKLRARLFEGPDYAAWWALRARDEARYLVLTLPRVLARPSHVAPSAGDGLRFTEDPGTDGAGRAWISAAYALGANVARAFARFKWCARIEGVETGGVVEGLPTHVAPRLEGGSVAHSVAEVNIGESAERMLTNWGFSPLARTSDVGLTAFSVVRALALTESGSQATATHLPHLFCACRFTQYLLCIARDMIGTYRSAEDLQRYLQEWIDQYVDTNLEERDNERRARHPLAAAQIRIEEEPAADDGRTSIDRTYRAEVLLLPYHQLGVAVDPLRVVTRLPG